MSLKFNPPDWLIQEYLNRQGPWQVAEAGAKRISDEFLRFDQNRRRNEVLKREGDQRQQLNDMAGRKMFYEYGDVSGLPPEVGGSIGQPVQGPVTEQGEAPAMSPVLRAFSEFHSKYPQGLQGAPKQTSSLNAEYSPEVAQGLMEGRLPAGPVPARAVSQALTAKAQAGTQDRFDTRTNETRVQKGAAAEMKVGDTLKQVGEAEKVLGELTKRHSELVSTPYAGNPAQAALGRVVGSVTGGGMGTAKARAYDSVAKGMVGRMKTLTGNVGMLTEFDQQRLEALLPGLGDNQETAGEKFKIMQDILNFAKTGEMQKLDRYLRQIGVKTEETGSSATEEPEIEDGYIYTPGPGGKANQANWRPQ